MTAGEYGLVILFVLVAVVFAYKGDYPKAAYCIGAVIILASVMVMK